MAESRKRSSKRRRAVVAEGATEPERLLGPESPERLGGPSFEQQRQLLHELRVKLIELEKQNHELRRALTLQESIFQGSRDAVFISDAESRFVAVNAAACELTGYSTDELLSMRIPDLHADVDLHAYDTHHDSIMAGAEVLSEAPTLRKEGWKVDTEFNSRRIDVDGMALMHTTGRDITARKRAEEALEHSRAQLLQAQKMEAVGRLAGGVAHDFNNILQAMLSLATVLRLKAGSPELARIVAEIEVLIRRGAGLTQQLLLYSRRQVAERKRVDLGEGAGAVGVLLGRLIPENIRLVVDTVPGQVWVDGDAGQLQQVLMNLVVNAKDAMPSGGTLTVRASRVDGDAVLAVIDTGQGMDETTRSRLFEPFFTTKDTGKGLGLSVVHGIAEQHSGRVEVESSPGEGSLFRVILPAMSPPDAAAKESSADVEPPSGHGERVLIVEDEEEARKGLAELLTIFGYEVTAVGSGEEAGVLPDEPAPDLLLTDLMLPGIDGVALAAGLRDRWPHLKVVLMSGYTEDEAVRRGVDEGEVLFLQKPFDMATLTHTLRAALRDPTRENEERT